MSGCCDAGRARLTALLGGVTVHPVHGNRPPFLIWTRLRPVMVASACTHFGIVVIMGLTMFSLYMYAMLFVLLPAKLSDRVGWGARPGRR